MAEVLLTTLDNPYNPWTDWDSWYNFDIQKGHDTCGKLARLAPSSMEALPEEYTNSLTEVAMDSLINLFPNIYTKISEEVSEEEFKRISKENIERYNKFAESVKKSS